MRLRDAHATRGWWPRSRACSRPASTPTSSTALGTRVPLHDPLPARRVRLARRSCSSTANRADLRASRGVSCRGFAATARSSGSTATATTSSRRRAGRALPAAERGRRGALSPAAVGACPRCAAGSRRLPSTPRADSRSLRMPVRRGARRAGAEDEVAEAVGDQPAGRLARIGCSTCGCAPITAVAPAASASAANARWRAVLDRGALDAPVEGRDHDVRARLRARRTPARISSGVAGCVPGAARARRRTRPAGCPRSRRTRPAGRAARPRAARSPRRGCRRRRRPWRRSGARCATVSSSAGGAVVAGVVVGEVEDVEAGVVASGARQRAGEPRKVNCFCTGAPRVVTEHSRLPNAMSGARSVGPTLVHG